MKRHVPPYIGAAYYPEAWPSKQIDEDIALMKETGLNVVRLGEFAWARMEPYEGEYDFGWLHDVIAKLGLAGIATVLGTPTCTPPVWLSEKFPAILVVNDAGVRSQHGARRHACPNSPVYRDYTGRIVRRMAQEFGHSPNVIAWQIDNELYPWGRGCCCDICLQRFHERLRARYGSAQRINEAWGLDLWSQCYERIDQVPLPRSDTWHHPSLLTEWMLFQSDSYADFAGHQSEILHAMTTQPIGTDMMPMAGLDYYRVHATLDFVQFNHYNDMSNLWEAAFWMDYCRPIKPKPFWVTETSTCWGGGTTPAGFMGRGFCRANSWLPLALGGEANMYWLWRTHWSGQELMHGAVVSTSGRPMHPYDEVRETARGFAAAEPFLTTTAPVKAQIAMHMSTFAWYFFQFQPLMNGFDYRASLMGSFYRPLLAAQLRVDVIDPTAPLDDYRVVLSPFLPSLEDGDLAGQLRTWIERGGVWIAGPFTDIRTIHGTKYIHAPFGFLEEWAGVRCKYEVPAFGDFSVRWSSGRECRGSVSCAGFESKGADLLATYTEYPLEGLGAVTSHRMGNGVIIVLGTVLEPNDLAALCGQVCGARGTTPAARATDNLLVVPREGPGGKGIVVVDIANSEGGIEVATPSVDLLTGRQLHGQVQTTPYEVMVLKQAQTG